MMKFQLCAKLIVNHKAEILFHRHFLTREMVVLSIIGKRMNSIAGKVKLEDVIEVMPTQNWL